MLKILLASLLSIVLVGCGGHGYEGKYSARIGSGSLAGGLFDSMIDKSDTESFMVLGKKYVDFDGERIEMDSISVVEEDGYKFLVLEADGESLHLEIVEDPLMIIMNTPFARVEYIKV